MQIVLSGGDLGGQTIDWVPQGTLPDGREFMNIENHQYAKIDSSTAAFVGQI